MKSTPADPAWNDFFDIYGSLVLSWLTRQGVQHADADDVRQEVMAAVLDQIQEFQHNGRVGAFRCWLRRITANRLHRLWQGKSAEQRLAAAVNLSSIGEELIKDDSRLSIAWDQEHDQYVLRALLDQLRPRFGESSITVFERVSMNQEPANEVAENLGMTLGAVRVAQHRVLRTLKTVAKDLVWLE